MLRKISLFFLVIFASILGQHANVHGHCYVNAFAKDFDPSWSTQHAPFLIHSIPKCGTHFIQRVIQLMIPKNIVNSHFSDQTVYAAYNNGYILRVCDLYAPSHMQFAVSVHHKVIAMVRDPRDALISHVFYMRHLGKLLGGNLGRDFFTVGPTFDSLSIDDQITALIVGNVHAPSYLQFYKKLAGWAIDTASLTVKYEDLLGEEDNESIRRNAIKRIARYLNLNLTEDHLEFILKNMYVYCGKVSTEDGKTFEHATKGNWKIFLNEHHKQLLKQIIGREIILLGYEKDLNW